VHVFWAVEFEGEPTATHEAIPIWAPVDAIPYEEMWEDDYLWVPLVLDDTRFLGRYLFDDDIMLDHNLEVLS